MNTHYDAIIIGAGHNGLVCANVLSKKGYKVLVLEANKHVGGLASRHQELAAGLGSSGCAHLAYGLHPEIEEYCQLDKAGFEYAATNISTLLVNQNKEFISYTSAPEAEILRSSCLSEKQSLRFTEFMDQMKLFSELLFSLSNQIPPRLKNGSMRDYKTLFNAGRQLTRLSKQDQRQFLRIIGMNIYDLVEENFDSDALKAAICYEAILGTRLGPRAPNTVYNFLNRRAIMDQQPNGLAVPKGGMGALTQALCDEALDKGVDVSISSVVSQILIENNQVTGVRLKSGDVFTANKVISNADIKNTMLYLVGPQNIDTDVVRRVNHIPMHGSTAKLNIVLNNLPESVTGDPVDFRSRIIYASNPDAIERASNAIKYNEYSDESVFEILIPSLWDKTLIQNGQHVMSVLIPYVPNVHKKGWKNEKLKFENRMLEQIETLFPGTHAACDAIETLTPEDIEKRFNVTGGHWHHGEIGLERFLMLRPANGFAQYSTCVDGLFLCGADCHPGGDVNGAAGLNAAKAVLSRRKS